MRFIFIILFLGPVIVNAQITDNFSDNNFSSNPAWNGDATDYFVNSSQQLQLNNTGAGASYLSTQSPADALDNTEWRFFIKQSFSPSSGNFGRVYLASDQADLEGTLNGYYLQFGESGNLDAVELFRQTGLTSTSIARGANAKIASSFAMGVKVTRDAFGNWKLFIDMAGGTAYSLQASGNDNTYTSTHYFGVSAVYTASNSTKFYFDDFYNGPLIIDVAPPAIVSSIVISDTQTDILFNESVELNSAQLLSNYSADRGLGNPVIARRDSFNFSLVHLIFANALESEQLYTLTITNVQDYNANAIAIVITTFSYYRVQALDLVINEILFDPKTNGVDFVEIYNRSAKVIDLKSITISKWDTLNNVMAGILPISMNSFFIYPGQYLVLSKDQFAVKNQYYTPHPNGFLDLKSFPSLTISGGTICLATATTIIDLFKYDPGMHFPLLNNTKGVSLERIDFDRTTQDPTNWHSAAHTVGFATPAYKNSQYMEAGQTSGEMDITPEIFSPDEDGVNDIVNINFHLDTPGVIANIIIYDSQGHLVRRLVRNQLLGTSGTFSWDGINEEREKSRIGIYIVYVETIDPSGQIHHYKKTCVLGGKI